MKLNLSSVCLLALASIACDSNTGSDGAGGASGDADSGAEQGGSDSENPSGTGGSAEESLMGSACSADPDCGNDLFCYRHEDGLLAHRQCTKVCSEDVDCEGLGTKASCLSGLGICVRDCESDIDCPEKTHCGIGDWCDRSGEGSGNAHCAGTIPSCSTLSGSECLSVLGCSDDSECSGVASSCYSQFGTFACSSQDGCYYASGSCGGSAKSCSSFDSEFTCGGQEGCSWSSSCSGVPIKDCSDYSPEYCDLGVGCFVVEETP